MAVNPNDPNEIAKVKKDIITGLTTKKGPFIIEDCSDVLLADIRSQEPARAFEQLVIMFRWYFRFGREQSLEKIQESLSTNLKANLTSEASDLPNITGSTSSKKSEPKAAVSESQSFFGCCLPCPSLTLSGNRAIEDLGATTERLPNIEPGDVYWVRLLEETNIDKIAGKILGDLEFGGKFPVPFDTVTGIISQIAINRINEGMSSRKKQRTSVSLKALGMKLDQSYSGLNISDMQIAPGMNIALQLIAKIEDFYNYRKVVQTIEAIAGQKISQQSIASIRVSIDLLRKSSEKFRHGTIAHNTLAAIIWKLFGFYLLLATAKQIGLSQERLEDIVDAARNMLLLNKIGTPSDKSRTKIYLDCANSLRDFILHILAPIDEHYWDDDGRLTILLNIEESRIESFIANFKEATGVDLTDKRWLREEVVVSHDLPNKL